MESRRLEIFQKLKGRERMIWLFEFLENINRREAFLLSSKDSAIRQDNITNKHWQISL